MEAIGIITSIEPPNVIAGISANKAKSYRKPARRLPNRQGSASDKPRLHRSIRSPTLTLNYPRNQGSNHRSETNCQLRRYRPRRLSASQANLLRRSPGAAAIGRRFPLARPLGCNFAGPSCSDGEERQLGGDAKHGSQAGVKLGGGSNTRRCGDPAGCCGADIAAINPARFRCC